MHPERYPGLSNPMISLMSINEDNARCDLQKKIFDDAWNYRRSRECKKAMKKITNGVIWYICTPIEHSHHKALLGSASLCCSVFPSLSKAAYWLELYISSGLKHPSTFIGECDILKIPRDPYQLYEFSEIYKKELSELTKKQQKINKGDL